MRPILFNNNNTKPKLKCIKHWVLENVLNLTFNIL